MPTILEESDIKLDRRDLADRIHVPRVAIHRPGGIHQSGVLYYIAKRIPSIAKTFTNGKFEEDAYPLLWALGQAWEEFVFSLYPEIEYQPGSVELNGIWRSVDGRSVIPHPALNKPPHNKKTYTKIAVVEEAKFTFKKVRIGQEFLEEWLYIEQGKGYCSIPTLYNPDGIRHVRYHVMYVRGNYKDFEPVYRRYLVEFTDKEIANSEKMLAVNRDKAEPEGD